MLEDTIASDHACKIDILNVKKEFVHIGTYVVCMFCSFFK